MTELTRKTSLGLAGLLLVSALAGMTSANTSSDVGGNEWCGDAIDNDFLLSGNPVGDSDYCDADSEDTAATITGSTTLSIVCVDVPNGSGSAADTRCTGGARTLADTVANRGELEDPSADWPLATGLSFSHTGGSGMRADYRVCFTIIADGSDAGCLDTFAAAPACLATGVSVDMVAAVGGAPVGAMPDAGYVFWSNAANPAALNVPSLTACGNADTADRIGSFDWSYDAIGAAGANVGAGVSADANVVGLTMQKFTDGCAPIYEGSASWAGSVGGSAGVWLLTTSQQQLGWASEVSGAGPQATSLADTGFVNYGDSATVVAYAFAVDEAGAVSYSATVPCELAQCTDPADTDGQADGGVFGVDPHCDSLTDDDESSGPGLTPPGTTECSDGVDNADPDSDADWPFDAECTDPLDNDETVL